MNIILKKMIDRSQVISFDIFDTLILRNVTTPDKIFDIVGIRNGDEKNFKSKRIEAEKIARGKSKKEDITLDDIYNNIEYDEKERNILKLSEIQTEIDYAISNKKIKEVYDYCKNKNKQIICVSDMYLDKETIRRILEKNEYFVDDIFVSSEFGKSKYVGSLFDLVREKYVHNNTWLHIGDRKKSDFINPIKKGLNAFIIRRNRREKIVEKNISNDIITSLIINNEDKCQNEQQKWGYKVLGPLCIAFLYWLQEQSIKNNINNLLFCARDMKLIQEIYEIIFSKEMIIKNKYFYVSRKSTFLPYLYKKNSFETLKKIAEIGKRSISLDELLHTCNINIKGIEINTSNYGIDLNKKYELEELRNPNFTKWYDELIKDYIEKVGKEQYDNFIKYLNKLDVNEQTAIVDLGWNGTTQNILINILGYNLSGFYFGLYSKKDKINDRNAYTFVFNEKEHNYSEKIFSYRPLFEAIFSALHGSTIKYTNDENAPYVLGENYNGDNKFLKDVQNGAIQFAKDLKIYSKDIKKIDSKKMIDDFIRIGISPTLKETKILGEIENDNFPVRKFAHPKTILYYSMHLKELKKDFRDSEWKVGFARRLLKINLPYYKIYKEIRRK